MMPSAVALATAAAVALATGVAEQGEHRIDRKGDHSRYTEFAQARGQSASIPGASYLRGQHHGQNPQYHGQAKQRSGRVDVEAKPDEGKCVPAVGRWIVSDQTKGDENNTEK